MEYINTQTYNHNRLINYTLDSNKYTDDNIFFEEKDIITSWIYILEKPLFLKAVVLLNFNSYSGYFALSTRKKLKDALLEENFNIFQEAISKHQDKYLEKEILAHNLWLARMIYDCADCELKYLIDARKRFQECENIINFKNKINWDNTIYDLKTLLHAVLVNNFKIGKRERKWLQEKYNKEIQIIKYYLELELASEIGDKSIEY